MEPVKRGKKTNNDRAFPGLPGPYPHRYEAKVAEAKERQAYWDGLSTKEKLADLDRRLGKGVGAKKQRARLLSPPKRAHSGPTSEAPAKPRLKAKERRAEGR